jgi:hypothetical protein
MSGFLEEVTSAFARLTSDGRLKVESSQLDEEAFGNALVVLAGKNLRVRLVCDRDESFADAASSSDPEQWHPLQRVIRAVGASVSPTEGLLSPAQAAELVERQFNQLEEGLAPERLQRTQQALADLGRDAFRRMSARIQPGR